MQVTDSERLVIRWLSFSDADFIHELVNDPDWIRFIGDRGVRSVSDARDYLLQGPLAMYERLGFGLYRVELKERGIPIGICGLIKRETLEDVDLGFAFLPRFRSGGYAHEAAAATLEYARQALGLSRVVAIVSPDNERSIHLLAKLGMTMERTVQLTDGAPELCLFGMALVPSPAGESAA